MIQFNRAQPHDVIMYSDADLLRLLEWAEYNITVIENAVDASLKWGAVRDLRDLRGAAAVEATERRLILEADDDQK